MAQRNPFTDKVQFTSWVLEELTLACDYLDPESDDGQEFFYKIRVMRLYLRGLEAAKRAYDRTMSQG